MVLLLLLLVHFPIGPLRDLKSLADRLVREVFEECGWPQLAVIALAAGFGEELLFRGVVQHAIAERCGPTVALVLASLIFGLAHPLSTTYVVLAGLIGLYLGWLWLATDNLLVPILAHAAYDFLALVYLRFLTNGEPTEGEASEESERWQ
jgi:membrane protease YdiL (CAAX protease family)